MKKAYAKIKAQELAANPPSKSVYAAATEEETAEDGEGEKHSATLELHPERQAMLNAPTTPETASPERKHRDRDHGGKRNQKPKRSAFTKEMEIAEKREQAAEVRRREREAKKMDREAMARARRPDQFGKRRLGRESKVLLSRVQRMVDRT